jgi:hypothetical protein
LQNNDFAFCHLTVTVTEWSNVARFAGRALPRRGPCIIALRCVAMQCQRALVIRTEAVGPDDPGLASRLDNYAHLLDQQGRTKEADRLKARAQAVLASSGTNPTPPPLTSLTSTALANPTGRQAGGA